MRPGSIALTAASALVALGGLYLMVEVRRGSAVASPEPAARAPTKAAAVATATPSIPKPQADRGGGGLPVLGSGDKRRVGTGDVGEPVKRLDTPTLAKYDEPPPSPEGEDDRLEANKAYDRGDYESARALALKSLAETPKNVKLLRVVVSSSCIMGDADVAQQYAPQLPEGDRAQMAERCAKFQIVLR